MIERCLFNTNVKWDGKLSLNFSVIEGRSVLSKYNRSGPFFVQKSFYSDHEKYIPHVYLLHPPGGFVGGDRLRLSVELEPNSHALITTPGSTKFYRTNGSYALQEHIFELSDNSVLEWVPQSNIFFEKTKAKISTIFKLSYAARMIAFDMLCFRNFNKVITMRPEEIDIFLDVSLPCSIGLRNHFKMNALNCLNRLNGFQMIASLLAVPADEILLKQVRKLIKPIKDLQIGGVTLLDELLVVRLLGNDNQILKDSLCHIWSAIRPSIIREKSIIPRIWFT